MSWGSAGRSPPTSVNAWGTPSQASSPPSGSGAWGPKAGAASVGGNSSISGGSTLGGPGNIPRPTSGGSGARPTSGGIRPLSAESIGQPQQSPDSFSSNANSSSAWGTRPSSASGVLGQAQPQLAQAQAQARPRSADISRPNRSLSEFGDQSGSHSPPGNAAWGNRGPPRRLVLQGFSTMCCFLVLNIHVEWENTGFRFVSFWKGYWYFVFARPAHCTDDDFRVHLLWSVQRVSNTVLQVVPDGLMK